MDKDLQKTIDERALEITKKYLSEGGFTGRKVTDTPIDALSVVNRRYTNLSGTLSSRPTSSVATMGQSYFATDINSGTPIRYNGNSSVWTNGVGSVVAGS